MLVKTPTIDIFKCRLHPRRALRFFYDARTRNDTIFAPATAIDPAKGSPLGVIRLSGTKSKEALVSLTGSHFNHHESPGKWDIIEPRKATLKKFRDPRSHELIDIGLVLWFPKPNSYTGEDVCEFHLHGSRAIMTKALDTIGSISGLRPAEPGEFTRRALMNGKMSLIQAESLPDLIGSRTENQRKFALKGLSGTARDKYQSWIERLVDILAHLEASIDFGEDELIGEKLVVDNCIRNLSTLHEEISNYISISSRCRDYVHCGFNVVILGKPNAGKSTFMNLLCKSEKSIVSGLSGTTRDIVEHSFELGGHALTLRDTAGLKAIFSADPDEERAEKHEADHSDIEREGIKRALAAAKSADFIIYLIDGNKLSNRNIKNKTSLILQELEELIDVLDIRKQSEELPIKAIHLVVNKIDLNEKSFPEETNDQITSTLRDNEDSKVETTISFISCKTQKNLDKLVGEITSRLDELTDKLRSKPPVASATDNNVDILQDLDYVNERHLSLLRSSSRHLERASELNLRTIDEMAQHVRESVDYLSRIVGSVSNEQVFDIIFRDFCIGK